ncbi:hypothetical protein GEV33_003081 [Tenebrio molitor]|uniref:SCP domain-containing protein n=1 Tax=Tenebrio molitor TaxID=7067 RepID=A0A8J6HS52_TENMO|nr:hypothetical protein GEV33_003081 [Tenebrio molitor]
MEEPEQDIITTIISEQDPEGQFDFTKFNYCNMNVPKCEGEKHSACDCKMRGQRTVVLDNLTQFRQDVLDKHNELRNFFASGKEPQKYVFGKTISNMVVLNYDLELEYIAKCYGGYFVTGHDKCRVTHDETSVGQNLAGVSAQFDDNHLTSIERWYNEVEYVDGPEYLYETWVHKNPPRGHIGHLTQLVWWSMRRVGCARIWNPANNFSWYKWAIICNYKAAPGLTPGNMKGSNIFEVGPPCTKCPFDWKCNVKYTSLCGKHYPAPRDSPTPTPHGKASERLVASQIISLGALVVLSYFC